MEKCLVIKWIGTIIGIIGVGILALAILPLMWIGFLFILISDIAWGYIGWKQNDRALMLINIVFGIANMIAIYSWFGRF